MESSRSNRRFCVPPGRDELARRSRADRCAGPRPSPSSPGSPRPSPSRSPPGLTGQRHTSRATEGQVKRPLLGQDADVEGRDLPRRISEAHHHPERLQGVERGEESILADRVIDRGNARTTGDLPDPLRDILAGRVDDVFATVGLGDLHLLVRADRPDDRPPRSPSATGRR
jgi:hypothetical protein